MWEELLAVDKPTSAKKSVDFDESRALLQMSFLIKSQKER